MSNRSTFVTGRILLATLLAVCIAHTQLTAQTAYFPYMSKEGSASIILSENTKTAFIVDGGKRSALVGSGFGPETLLSTLHEDGYRHVVILCSHPHADHEDGVVDLVKYKSDGTIPDISSFESVTLIDASYDKESNLYNSLKSIHGELRNATHLDATARDAFESIPHLKGAPGNANAQVSNFVYTPDENAGIHGSSIITHTILADDKGRTLLVDFDDASSKLIATWANWARDNLPTTDSRIFVAPHHGSRHNDITPLCDPGIRPEAVIVAVNPRNRYKHPHAEHWNQWIDAVGLENIHFTGVKDNRDERSVKITASGLSPVDPEELALVRSRILRPLIKSAERDVRLVRERWIHGSESRLESRYNTTVSRLRNLRRIELYYSAADPRGETPTEFASLHVWSPFDQGNPGEPLDPDGPTGPRRPDGGPTPRPTSPRPSGPTDGGVAHFVELQRSSIDALDSSIAAESDSVARFRTAIRMQPKFGGVILGNRVAGPDASLLKAEILMVDEDDLDSIAFPRLRLLFDVPGRGQTYFEYDEATSTEMWCAHHFVMPPQQWQRDYDLERDQFNLIGTKDYEGTPDGARGFGIHPAIANTPIAVDAMHVDLLPGVILDLGSPDSSASKALTRYRENYEALQWFDIPTRVSLEGSSVVVTPEDSTQRSVLQLRFWSYFSLAKRKDIGPLWEKFKELSRRSTDEEKDFKTLALDELSEEEIDAIKEKIFPAIQGKGHHLGTAETFVSMAINDHAVLRVDSFARTVALLNYIKRQADVPFPVLPDTLAPLKVDVAPEMEEAEVARMSSLVEPKVVGRVWLWIVTTIAICAALFWLYRTKMHRMQAT